MGLWILLAVGFSPETGAPDGFPREGMRPSATKTSAPPFASPRPLTSAPSRPGAQEPSERELAQVIKLRSDLVTVMVTVSGPSGRLVADLQVEDFEILEEGVPQTITTFMRHSEMPLNLVLIFDASLSIRSRLKFEKDVLARFLRTIVRPIDQAAIFSVSTDVIVEQYFTDDIERLLSATDHLSARGATALYDAIQAAAESLHSRQGRRVIIVLSDGRDTISRNSLRSSLRQAQYVDAVIYAIYTLPRETSANVRNLSGERALESICNETGGEVFYPNTIEDLDPILVRLAEQLRTQYILGFTSTNDARDGSYRRLTVRVKRPGIYARSRAGYYAPAQ